MNEGTNTFAHASANYARSRPLYPPDLFEWIAAQCERHDAAWDCATGNGQAALGLAPYFAQVYATDVSREQLEQAMPQANVYYSAQSGEQPAFADNSFDLIVVAQALHWFDFARFWPEVMRVARRGAFFCAWGYDWLITPPEIDQRLVQPFRDIIAPYWAANNQLLWNGYRDADIAFPFTRLATPNFSMQLDWTVDQLLAYLQTWSAYKRSQLNEGAQQHMERLLRDIQATFDPAMRFSAQMQLKLVAARINS